MRFQFTIGRFVVFDFTLFEISATEDEDVVVVRHHYVQDDENDGPGDLFGNK